MLDSNEVNIMFVEDIFKLTSEQLVGKMKTSLETERQGSLLSLI